MICAVGSTGGNLRVTGRVVGGARVGAGLGFPTANVPLPVDTALAHGIYAARAFANQATHDAAVYFGTRPTFDDGFPMLEVFLLDFDGDLYGQVITVEFFKFIRADRKFTCPDELVAQMNNDVAAVRAAFCSR